MGEKVVELLAEREGREEMLGLGVSDMLRVARAETVPLPVAVGDFVAGPDPDTVVVAVVVPVEVVVPVGDFVGGREAVLVTEGVTVMLRRGVAVP